MTAPKQWSSRTADNRTLTPADFRRIPGFSKYRISLDGDVMNVRTGKLLRESVNPTTGAWAYTLWRDGGGKTSRNYQSLVALAWGDTKTTEGAA